MTISGHFIIIDLMISHGQLITVTIYLYLVTVRALIVTIRLNIVTVNLLTVTIDIHLVTVRELSVTISLHLVTVIFINSDYKHAFSHG